MASIYAKFFLSIFCTLLHNVVCQRTVEVANLMFAENILKELVSKYSQRNLVVSPYFIQRMMALAMYGAKDQLRAEILNVTELKNLEADEYLPYFKKFPNTLVINNQMFYNKSLQLRKVFTVAAEKYFETKPQVFEEDDSEKAANFINQLVERGSKHFNNFIDAAFMERSLAGLFLNTVYFKDQWKLPFDGNSKRARILMGLGKTEAITLYGVRNVGYAELSSMNATVIQLPYKDSAVQLLILLPNQDAKDINWSKFRISEILEELELEHVALSLPLFSVETQIDLSSVLTNMGLKNLFTPRPNLLKAFQRLLDDAEFGFVHAAQFDFTEYGSNMKMGIPDDNQSINDQSNVHPPSKLFIVDRPFIFVLHSRNAVYMVGRIVVLDAYKNVNIKIKYKGDKDVVTSTSNVEESNEANTENITEE